MKICRHFNFHLNDIKINISGQVGEKILMFKVFSFFIFYSFIFLFFHSLRISKTNRSLRDTIKYDHLFSKTQKTNRVELVSDFPKGNDAEVISSLQVRFVVTQS